MNLKQYMCHKMAERVDEPQTIQASDSAERVDEDQTVHVSQDGCAS